MSDNKDSKRRRQYADGNRMGYIEVEYEVRVRKYNVDIQGLQKLLRSHKKMTNKQIADSLGVPLTNVEHWFRTDIYFSIPDAEIWEELKALLKIESTEFDKQITEFIVKPGVFEKSGRLYFQNGIAPTVTAADDVKVIVWK